MNFIYQSMLVLLYFIFVILILKFITMKTLGVILLAVFGFTLNMNAESPVGGMVSMESMITSKEVMKTQKMWGEGIVKIGNTFTQGGDYVKAAEEHINTLYAYGITDVLFKPTKAAEKQFRMDYDGALSYFVGKNKNYEEDGGFAINPWTKVRFENEETFIYGNTALAMGNYYFTTTEGNEVKVEYSFGYIKDDMGNLRIVLHHSSLPFQN